MYEKFYGFNERPFSLLPDPDFLYLSEKHQTAVDLLELTIFNQSGFCVVTGEIGAGKTTLIRELLSRLSEDICVGLVSNTHPSFGELLQWVMSAYDVPCESDDKFELHKCFLDFVIQQYAKHKRTLLIIDEAQNLSVSALEELRMLSNVNSDKDLVLQVVLVGQNQLRDKLKSPELEQFAQRIAVDYHLAGLGEQETFDFIRHRVTHAGGAADLFSEDACRTVFRCSGGIPRLINGICDLSLVYGFSEKSPLITPQLVRAVVNDQRTGNIRKPHGHLPPWIPDVDLQEGQSPGDKGPERLADQAAGVAQVAHTPERELTAGETTVTQATADVQAVNSSPDPGPAIAGGTDLDTTPKEPATIVGSMNPVLLQGGFEAKGLESQRQRAAEGNPAVGSLLLSPAANGSPKSDGRRRPTGLLLVSVLVLVTGVAGWGSWSLWSGLPVSETVVADSPGQVVTPPGGGAQPMPQEAERRLAQQREAQRLAGQLEAERELAEQRATAERLAEQQEAERELAEQREAQRLAEQQEAERRLAQQREVQRLAEQQEAERQLAEQRAAQRRQETEQRLVQQREVERLAEIKRRKAAEEAERREWERLTRVQREAELDMAKHRAALRLEQERQRAERDLTAQRDKERLARIEREAELEAQARRQAEAMRGGRQRRQQQAEDGQQAQEPADQSLEARRTAAQTMWNQLGDEPEWSEEAEDEPAAIRQQADQDVDPKALGQKAPQGDATLQARRAASRAAWQDVSSEIEWSEEFDED